MSEISRVEYIDPTKRQPEHIEIPQTLEEWKASVRRLDRNVAEKLHSEASDSHVVDVADEFLVARRRKRAAKRPMTRCKMQLLLRRSRLQGTEQTRQDSIRLNG